MNKTLRYTVGTVALIGFALALITHVMALAGTNLGTAIPAVWDLHVGIFAVFLPFVLLSKTTCRASASCGPLLRACRGG